MPTFHYSGTWDEHTVEARGAASWTDSVDDEMWAWDGTTWRLIQPSLPDVGPGSILPVVGLAVQGGYPLPNEVRVQWTNPGQPYVEPNEVWYRIREISTVWTVVTYPVTTAQFFALQPGQTYTIDVLLANRVGLVVQTSATKSITATTPNYAPAPPTGTPDVPTSTDVPLPPTLPPDAPLPPGTPGAPGSCWLEWKLELAAPEVGWIVVQTGEAATAATITFADLTPGAVYKLCTRAKCSNGFTGAWSCNAPWVEPTDWTDPCADHDDPRYALAPYLDAAWIVPQVCAPDTVREKVTNAIMSKGPLFGGLSTGPYSGSIRLLAAAGLTDGAVVQNDSIAAVDTMEAGSFTVASWVRAPSNIGIGLPVPYVSQTSIRLGLYGTVPGNVAYAWFTRPDLGTLVELYGTTVLANNVDHHLAVVWDNTTKVGILYVNGVAAASTDSYAQSMRFQPVASATPLNFQWWTRNHNGGTNVNFTQADVKMLVRLKSLTLASALWAVDGSFDFMCLLQVYNGKLSFYYMVNWSPFTSNTIEGNLPAWVRTNEWVWTRVLLGGGTLSVQVAPPGDPTNWTTLASAAVTTIPYRAGIGDAQPFYVGGAQVVQTFSDFDIRQIKVQFNNTTELVSTFETSTATVLSTTAIRDDQSQTWTDHASYATAVVVPGL